MCLGFANNKLRPMSVKRLLSNGMRYWRAFGTRALLRELQRRLATPVPPGMLPTAIPTPDGASARSGAAQPGPPAQALIGARFGQCAALPVFVVPRTGRRRISIVTDSINKGSLFGGVGTSMILAALLVRQRGARLRVITRTEPAQAANLHDVLQLYGLAIDDEVEFAFAHVNAPQAAVNTFADELFITTSWWTTESALAVIAPSRILYVLQEDERMFYPAGDDQLRCQRLLANEHIHVVVNTPGLLEHLVGSGLPHLERRARAFEPAFPPGVYCRQPAVAGQRRRFMFYARPNHLRNLFYFGLEVVDQAIAQGVIDTRAWEIHFVGAHVPALTLCDGSTPIVHEHLSWPDYAALAGTIDVALSLMFTPHPSYPPLDLAASGAVVLSNRHGNKTELSHYCENILLAELNLPAMLDALREALILATDEPERERRFASRGLQQDWAQALDGVVRHFGSQPDAWA